MTLIEWGDAVGALLPEDAPERRVYLPPGLWHRFAEDEGTVLDGPGWHTLAAREVPAAVLVRPDGPPESRTLTVWASTQAPHRLRSSLAAGLGLPDDQVQVERVGAAVATVAASMGSRRRSSRPWSVM